MTTLHPQRDDHGHKVVISHPDTPSAMTYWCDPQAIAVATPGCPMPRRIGSVEVAQWRDAPASAAAWQALVQGTHLDEPPLSVHGSRKPSAGCVTIEPDGRVWVVAPTNGFGGYPRTFPKGKTGTMSPHATAIKETHEESGLQVELLGFLCDSIRTTSVARYYIARRLGGSPAAMGWESQAVLLVPSAQLTAVVTHPNDQPIVKKILAYLRA